MSTIALIHKEVETLPGNLQRKVLAFVELLKYKSTLQQVEKLTQELGGAQELADDDIRALLSETHDEPGGDWSVEELQEKIAVVERVYQVLENIKAGSPGIRQMEMKERIRHHLLCF